MVMVVVGGVMVMVVVMILGMAMVMVMVMVMVVVMVVFDICAFDVAFFYRGWLSMSPSMVTRPLNAQRRSHIQSTNPERSLRKSIPIAALSIKSVMAR